jgi:hypothetical protein
MNLYEFKKEYVRQELGISESFGQILSFIDFGNVNYWFEEDRQDYDHNTLAEDQKLGVDIEKLKEFTALFSRDARFYYGHDRKNPKSLGFIRKARRVFGKHRVFTKPIQKIKHYLSEDELNTNTRDIHKDGDGNFIFIPKCNFDVEISVDAIKLIDSYDTFCLFSSDADFVHLVRFLKYKNKKTILIKGGPIVYQLRGVAEVVVNAQDIKKHIAIIKQKPDNKARSCGS